MDSFTEDIWVMILARLPQKSIITSKLVCKQWKSIAESPYLRKLFLSHHQNSHPSWSLMCKDDSTEALAYYGCVITGPSRPLGCYINSFVKEKFNFRQARVVAYTDVGLVLIRVLVSSDLGNILFYVANPVTRECVETDPPWFEPKKGFFILGIATRTENGLVLGYKVVLHHDDPSPWGNGYDESLSLIIYSSETGSWRFESVDSPYYRHEFGNSISVNGNLHWLAQSHDEEVVVSIDFYGSGRHQFRVTPFPDLETSPRYKRSCTTSQGYLMYMNVGKDDGRLRVWRLKSAGWQLASEIALKKYVFPIAINPFDAETVYFWKHSSPRLLSLNLRTGKKIVLHGNFERCSDGRIIKCQSDKKYTARSNFSSFVLPKWLHPIPRGEQGV
ncbi:unnamed protein product [Microthlaspi erraticum]|uniref:F-box domain-containing protein n=1 Tax=Microthlaspi erraticum TaxID=1685480 RepID=A0A6D2IKP1_9BRAS|nr:unnamed protein product [Microthlaspi erraticum]